jgi:hypothetical protein
MFGRKQPEKVSVEVDVEFYALANAAERLRSLEQEIVACFEEWSGAQKSSAEKAVLVEFKMSPWLGAAWSNWRSHQFGGADEAITSVIPQPDKWPG